MKETKKYLHLIVGYTGLLLIGIAILRSLSVFLDTIGYALTMIGYFFISFYFKFADEKIGATKKEKAIFRIGFLCILGVVALYIYYQYSVKEGFY